MLEAGDHLVAIEAELKLTLVKVEQVAILVPLKQRPHFGAEDFLGLEGDDLSRGMMLTAFDLEGVGLEAVAVLVFSRIYLNLEFERDSS